MQRSILVPVLLAQLGWCPWLPSQSALVTPTACGYERTGGLQLLNSFGLYADMRVQWAEGELGATARNLTSFGMRASHRAVFYQARSYSRVRVRLSDGDHQQLSWTFTQNLLSTATTVFDRPMVLPEIRLSGSNPTPWDPRLLFSFTTPYLHQGTRDLLIDLSATGGLLASGAPWSNGSFYGLDAPDLNGTRVGTRTVHGYSGCGRTFLQTTAHDTNYSFPVYQNTHTISYSSSGLKPGARVVHALGGFGRRSPLAWLGGSCGMLYLDLGRPFLLLVRQANQAGQCPPTFVGPPPHGVLPYNPAWVGLPLWLQAAWDDGGQMRLTQATETFMPAAPPRLSFRRMTLLSDKAARIQGSLYGWSAMFPILRYTY